MKNFFYTKKNILSCEDTEITKIAESVRTPFYVYSSEEILGNFEQYRKAFDKFDTLICFALKANSNLSIIRLLKNAGAGVDIVSGGELFKALEVEINPKKIVYAGVGKTEAEINYALCSDILMFNTESLEEIALINKIALRLHKKACIAIRVNPDVNPKTHPYISTGLAKNKFGFNIKNVKDIIVEINKLPNIILLGIHMHIGSQLIDMSPLFEGIQKIKLLIEDLRGNGINIKYLNLGGGLGIKYNNEIPPAPGKYFNLIKPLLDKLDCKIILEPGRSIVGNAGILVTKIIYNKYTENKKFIIVDAGMNDLIRPALYDAYHDIIPVEKKDEKIEEKADIVGPICETSDFFARDRLLPKVEQEKLLAVMSAGAYGFSMSSNYNSRPKPAEVMVTGKTFKIIRYGESYTDLVQKEHINAIPFSKISGSGNDFIVIDNRNKIIKTDLAEFTRRICDYKNAIGADGLLILEESQYKDVDFMMRIFNKDGSEAEMCGNGARCIVRFAYDKKIVISRNVRFETKSGIIIASINHENNLIKLKMQDPMKLKLDIKIKGFKYEMNFINTGVPHTVIFTQDNNSLDINKLGSIIRNHKYFSPGGTNVDFVNIIQKNKISIRTFERGVEGETLACGTGATASALIYALKYKVKSPIEVVPKSNDTLVIYYKSSQNSFNDVYLEGSVKMICNGHYYS